MVIQIPQNCKLVGSDDHMSLQSSSKADELATQMTTTMTQASHNDLDMMMIDSDHFSHKISNSQKRFLISPNDKPGVLSLNDDSSCGGKSSSCDLNVDHDMLLKADDASQEEQTEEISFAFEYCGEEASPQIAPKTADEPAKMAF